MKAVIDTNVLLVANGQHDDASPGCVVECVQRLQAMQREGIVVVDDGYRILGEYQNKTCINPAKGVGDIFLKWLLRNSSSPRVEQVSLVEIADSSFAEFPDPALELLFDASDRKFPAVANVHPGKPPIWQAVDCKWLNWWATLKAKGVEVEFLCPDDICLFYSNKFPGKPLPALPTRAS